MTNKKHRNLFKKHLTNGMMNLKRLIRAAKKLGKSQIAEQVQQAKDNLKNEKGISWYNPDNTAADGREPLENKNINLLN